VTTIQQSVDDKQTDPLTIFKGREIGLWFVFAALICEIVAALAFYRTTPGSSNPTTTLGEKMPPDINARELLLFSFLMWRLVSFLCLIGFISNFSKPVISFFAQSIRNFGI
jgi:hypothetical protein